MVVNAQHRMNMKSSVSFLFITLILLLLAAGCSSEPKNTPEEAIEQFELAIKNNNLNAFMDITTSMDKMYTLTKQDAQVFIDYFKENKAELEGELERLDAMADGKKPAYDAWYDDSPLLYLTYSEGKWGGNGQYKVGIQPPYLKIYTNFDNTDIYLNDTLHSVAESSRLSKVIGPLVPGEYTLRAEYQTESAQYTSEEQTVSLPESSGQGVDLRVAAENITFDSNYEDADLYLNGEFTGMSIAEAKEKAQLLATDGSIKAQVKYVQNGVLLESEPVSIIGHNNNYYLELPAEYVFVSTTLSGGQLYVDDKATGFSLFSDRENEYGPLVADTTVKLHAEVDSPWGRITTSEEEIYVYGGEPNYSFLFYKVGNEELKKSIEDALVQFMQSAFYAYSHYDAELMQNVTEDARYSAFDTLNYTIYSGDSTLIGMRVYTGYADVHGAINGSVIEGLGVNPILVEVTYEYPYSPYSYYWDDDSDLNATSVVDSRTYRVAMSYNTYLDQWEVAYMVDEYAWWPELESADSSYYDFR